MITNPNWLKPKEPKEKPYFHQISLYCIERLIECIEEIAAYIEDNDIEGLDCNTCLIMQEPLSDKIDNPEFLEYAIENFANRIYGFDVIT